MTASAAYIRAVTFRRHPHWVTTAPVDDPRETYEAELRSLLANFGYRRFRRFVLLWTRLDPPWAVILIGIYRSMIRDLREAAVMLRRRSSLGPKPKAPVAPL